MRSTPRPRFPLAAIAMAATLAGFPAAQAQEPDSPTIKNVRVGFTDSARGRYKVGTWTPVWIDLQGGRSPFRGQVELTTPDDDGTPTAIRFDASLPASQPSTLSAIVRPGTRSAEVAVRLLGPEGQPVGPSRPKVVAPEPMEPFTRLILEAGTASGLDEVVDLPRFRNMLTEAPALVVAPLEDWPGVWYGFDGVEAIVLETGDLDTLERLRGEAGRVLRDWVAQGGHLVVTLGDHWEEARKLLDPLLPAEPTEPVRLTDVSSIETFAGNPPHPLDAPINAVRLDGWQERGAVLLATAASTPLVVRGPYGLGRVTLVSLDVAGQPFSDWEDKRLFWDRVLDLRGRTVESEADLARAGGAIIQAAAPELAAVLHRKLEAFPGVRIMPFGWVAFAVFAYIVLIGPLDYLFLKRVVKRMEMTWITFPLIVVAVTVLAYFGAHALKGDALRVNKVDLLDYDQTSGQLRGTTWLTVFSPSNHDYGLAIHPNGPDLAPEGPSAELATTTLSWFAPPVPVLGGTGRVAFGNAGYRYGPSSDQPEALAGVRIPIWSTKSFTGRWTGTAHSTAIESDLEPTSGDRVAGSVRNLLDVPLRNVQLYYSRNLYNLGTIRPQGIARVDPTRTEAMSSYLGRLTQSLERRRRTTSEPDHAEADPTASARADVIRSALFHEAMGTRGAVHPNQALRTLDLTAQVSELRRPILVAEVDAPAASLELKDASAAPEVAQTTLIRIILPLGDGSETQSSAARGD